MFPPLKMKYVRNKLNKNKTVETNLAYKRQKKVPYFLVLANLNPNVITDNKKFWKTIKPLFSEKRQFLKASLLPRIRIYVVMMKK